MTLTRATLGTLTKRKTRDLQVCGHDVRIQKPTPLEYSQYQMALVDGEGKFKPSGLESALRLLMARMWIDADGNRVFKDNELGELALIDLEFYQRLSEECQLFARSSEAKQLLGESEKTIDSDLPVESV